MSYTDSAIHSKTKLIHEHDFITARNKEANKHFLSIVLLAEYTTVTFLGRLCVKKHRYRGFANEKIQQH